MEKLKVLSDFVTDCKWAESGSPIVEVIDKAILFNKILSYTDFLKQNLKLSMFIPCDENENILKEPESSAIETSEGICGYSINIKEVEEYDKAKERVLFKDFELIKWTSMSGFGIHSKKHSIQICVYKEKLNYFIWNYKTIEDLCVFELSLTNKKIF